MLMWLSEQLLFLDPGFGVFQYLTLRAILAACSAMLISMLVGPFVLTRLNDMQIGQPIRSEGTQSHLVKAGTQTMGGALILIEVLGSTMTLAEIDIRMIWVVIQTTTVVSSHCGVAD